MHAGDRVLDICVIVYIMISLSSYHISIHPRPHHDLCHHQIDVWDDT